MRSLKIKNKLHTSLIGFMASGSKPDCLSCFFSLITGILVWEHNSIIIITLIGPRSVWTNNQYSRLRDALYAELTLPRISVPEKEREVWKHLHFINNVFLKAPSLQSVRELSPTWDSFCQIIPFSWRFFFFFFGHRASGSQFPDQGWMETMLPAVEAQSPNQGTSREFPWGFF